MQLLTLTWHITLPLLDVLLSNMKQLNGTCFNDCIVYHWLYVLLVKYNLFKAHTFNVVYS